MRKDMSKVIVERPRSGAGRLRNRPKVVEDEVLPTQIGMKRDARERGGQKMLNENLKPLRRFLERQVGRPWNKVWSEVCENLQPANTVQQHVRDHIPDFVGIKTRMKDGEVWVQGRWRTFKLKESNLLLYVDPRTGLLCRNKKRTTWAALQRTKKAEAAKLMAARMRVLSDELQLHLLNDGAWWEIKLAPIPTQIVEQTEKIGLRYHVVKLPVRDAAIGAGLTDLPLAELYGRRDVYGIAKRQLSKREIRDFGLRDARK